MKRVLLSLVIFSSLFMACQSKDSSTPTENNTAQGAALPPQSAIPIVRPFELFFADFKAAVAKNDPKVLSDLCDFPFDSGTKQSELIEGFEFIFDTHVRQAIEKFTLDDWKLNADGKHQAILDINMVEDDHALESKIIFIAAPRADRYKLVDIIIVG